MRYFGSKRRVVVKSRQAGGVQGKLEEMSVPELKAVLQWIRRSGADSKLTERIQSELKRRKKDGQKVRVPSVPEGPKET